MSDKIQDDSKGGRKYRPQTEGEWEQLRQAAYYNICDRCLDSEDLDVYHTDGFPKMLCNNCANGETTVAEGLLGLAVMLVFLLSLLF